MALTSRHRLAWPAWALAALLGGLVLAAALGGSAAAPSSATAQGEEGRYSVLAFSRTTGTRHTEAINTGHAALDTMAAAQDFDVVHSEDQTLFSDHSLRSFDVVVFLNSDGEGILNDRQRNAFERWTQRGGGAVRIHGDGNADKAWDWKRDMMGGGLFANHPPIQEATLEVADATHPATAELPASFQWSDEWYNFDQDPREDVHVLLTVDESTYEGGEHGSGHPIAWCSEYDGGRNFYTAIGHADGGASPAFSDERYLAHISGAIEWAAGEAPGDCGPARPGLPTEASLNKVTLDDGAGDVGGDDTGPETENPMELDVANDGRVFFVEIGAGALDSFNSAVKMYDPGTDETYEVGEIPVHRRNENGLLGITLDPNFDQNNFIYLFYSVPGPQNEMGTQHISRFTFDPEAGEVGMLDTASEVVLLEAPHQRRICCHSAGSLAFGPDGFLYTTLGDDTTPFQTSGFNPHDPRECGPGPGTDGCSLSDPPDATHAFDARRTSGNAADLRGKLLRIDPIESATPEDEPGLGSTYTVDDQNLFTSGQHDDLFPGGVYDPELGRPEIYAMGWRNPFRLTVDEETGHVYVGQVGPDASNDCFPGDSTNCTNNPRGPRGYDTINQVREAANMGWPYCLAGEGYYEYDYATNTSGEQFDCEGGPTNNSPHNTGIETLPPVSDPLIWYPYGESPEFPEIPPGSARTAMAGPVYNFDPELDSDAKLSEYFDGKLFWGEWSRNLMMLTTLDENGDYLTSEEFMPSEDWRHPHDIELGPDGALYIIEWGNNFNFGAEGINNDSGLYRIEQRLGGLPAQADARANPNTGQAPLDVQFTGELSDRGADDPPTYEWDFGDGGTSTEPNPAHTYEEAGVYEATLTVTDAAGTTTDTVNVRAVESCVGGTPLSDDFEGAELNRDLWTVVREDPENLSVSDGALNIVSGNGDFWQTENNLPNMVIHEGVPLTDGPWSVTTEMSFEPSVNFHNAGLLIYGDDDNWIKFGHVWSDGRQFEQWKELNADPLAAGGQLSGVLPGDFPTTFFMRFTSEDGFNVDAEYSADGEDWQFLGTRTLEGIDNPRIGLYATATGSEVQPTASFHSFTVEPDQGECPETCLRSDEFDDLALSPDRWNVRIDEPGDYSIEDGQVVLPIQNEVDGAATGPVSLVTQHVPEGDWSLTTRVTPDLNTSWAQAGIMLWQSDGNFVKYVFGRDANNGNRRVEMTSDDPIDVRNIGPSDPVPIETETMWLRLYREGDTIFGEYAFDEGGEPGEWVQHTGTRPVSGVDPTSGIEIDPPREGEGVQLGLLAGADIDGAPYEQLARFDFARFEPDDLGTCPEEDTTPPETTHALDPPDPGEGGTYDGPVDVTLSATDLGDGAPEPQTHQVNAQPATWDPDALELALGDEIQWNFPASANFNHDVWRIAPGEAPASAGTEVTDGPVPAGGEPVTATFGQPGSWTFFCKIHSIVAEGEWQGMVGTANVAEGGGEASGVDFTEYRVHTDGLTGDWVQSENTAGDDPFETSFIVSDPGDQVVEYRSTDNAGNVEQMKSVEFSIVGDPPPEVCPRSDGFDGQALDPERWEVVRPDPVRLSVADGALHLVAAPMDIFAGETGLPNIVVQPLPEDGAEPWSITTELTWAPTQNFQNAGLIVYDDDNNYVKMGMVWNGGMVADGRSFELIKETAGTPTFPGTADTPDGFPSTFFLRLVSADGNALVSEFSADGTTWTEIGTTDLTGISGPRIGVYATASTQAGVSEPTASFHSVAIEPECEPGNNPPVIDEISADPDQGDAPLEVSFSAAASDPDGDQLSYAWEFGDGGSSDQQSPSHTYADPGVYEAELTVSDGTDEVSDSVTVTVNEPVGAPALDGRALPKRRAVKPGKSARFTFRVANEGDAPAEGLRLCVKAPRKKVKVMGKACKPDKRLPAGEVVNAAFKLKAKRSAAGDRITVRFNATAANAAKETATATLKVKRKRRR